MFYFGCPQVANLHKSEQSLSAEKYHNTDVVTAVCTRAYSGTIKK